MTHTIPHTAQGIGPAIAHRSDDTPGREGSAESCAILLLLHKHESGLPASAIVALTGLPVQAVQAALLGLQYRNRITPRGRGMASRWYLPIHAPKDAAP
jgi:hypothetical protein